MDSERGMFDESNSLYQRSIGAIVTKIQLFKVKN